MHLTIILTWININNYWICRRFIFSWSGNAEIPMFLNLLLLRFLLRCEELLNAPDFTLLQCSVPVKFMCTFYSIRYCGIVKWWYQFWLICDGPGFFSKSFRSTVNQIESRDPWWFDVKLDVLQSTVFLWNIIRFIWSPRSLFAGFLSSRPWVS